MVSSNLSHKILIFPICSSDYMSACAQLGNSGPSSTYPSIYSTIDQESLGDKNLYAPISDELHYSIFFPRIWMSNLIAISSVLDVQETLIKFWVEQKKVDDISWNCQALCVHHLFVEIFGEDSITPLMRNSSDNLGFFFYRNNNLHYFSTSPTELMHQTTNALMAGHNLRRGKSDEGYQKSCQIVLKLTHKMLKDREKIKSLNIDTRVNHSKKQAPKRINKINQRKKFREANNPLTRSNSSNSNSEEHPIENQQIDQSQQDLHIQEQSYRDTQEEHSESIYSLLEIFFFSFL